MAKSIKPQDNIYWDSTGIIHNKKLLSDILEDTGWVKLTVNDGLTIPYDDWKPVIARKNGNVVQILGVVKGVTKEWQEILTLPEKFRPQFLKSINGYATYQYITPCINNPKSTQCLNINPNGNLNLTTVFGRTLSAEDEITLDCVYLV